ncbi:LytR/AlgR family response regulator transcription factor [Flavobacterium aestivum]|uniref:LytR/AlgR family response regulator transcription factor n=1 Tax=Flavobacterium aestivum TaxID=3003257 RepID=UPI002482D383|nr:LytTR family DNA-binding domain-containing protein [Flavobacterium aestivum]
MNILIIEDEARIAKRLERMIRDIFGNEITSLRCIESLTEGIKHIEDNLIDLLFLDLNLNGEDGFNVLESVVSERFHTIIVSAYKEKAIKAFEYGVLDFVAKPFDEERLAKACQRIKSKSFSENKLKYLSVKKKGRQSLININDLKYIKGSGIYTELHLTDGKIEIYNKTLENLSLLLPESFLRIHKSYIVKISEAIEIIVQPGTQYGLRLRNEEVLPIGRTRYKMVKDFLVE